MPRNAALRIAEQFVKAKEGNYYRHGWAGYIRREDVEAVVLAQLSPTERAVYRSKVSETSS